MITKERCILLGIIGAVVLVTIFTNTDADDWDYYYDDHYYEPIEIYEVYPTIPGTSIRDYNQPGYRIEADRYGNERGYPLIPGTNIRDYNQPGYHIERR